MNQKQYIREIVQRSCLPARERQRLKRDLNDEINSALERGEHLEQVIERMGEPDQVAAALYENFADAPVRPFREYKSKATLFGLPLVHVIRSNHAPGVAHVRGVSIRGINFGGRYARSVGLPTACGFFAFGPKAKGVVAVSNISAGVIAIGNIATGILSIGNISAGLFSLGNIALALFTALGNLAAGLFSLGNMALGYAIAGNLAVGQYAVGNEGIGVFSFSFTNLAAQFEEIKAFISGLDASVVVKQFYGAIEGFFGIIVDSTPAIPSIIALSALLVCAIAALCIIPRRLLNRSI